MRDIKGPDGVNPRSIHAIGHDGKGMTITFSDLETMPCREGFFTAQEVGQIIALAMDAQMYFSISVGSEMSNSERKYLMDKAMAWRALSERLKDV